MRPPDAAFLVDPSTPVLPSLQAAFVTHVHGERTERRTYFDTFDGRLRARRDELYQESSPDSAGVVWRSGTVESRFELNGRPLGFSHELAAGPGRSKLERLVAPRKLLPTVEVETRTRRVDVLDPLEKTVVRVEHREAWARRAGEEEWTTLADTWVLQPVLGFDADLQRVLEVFSEHGRPVEAPTPLVELALESTGAGATPPSPGSLELEEDVPAALGLQQILARHLEIMRANEPGVRADVDPEFLHDFRVAVRRTRALLGQVRGVLSARATELYRRDFAWLGTVTGPVRDLDVMLGRLRKQAAVMEPHLLEPLVARLHEEREQERARLLETLDSPRYVELVRAWASFTTEPLEASALGKHSEKPLRDVLARRIWKLYRKIRKRQDNVAEGSEELLHEVRLDCKKLRYLIEPARLVIGKRVAPTQKALRKLQNVLGDVNDCRVQTATLERYARELDSAGPEPLLAIGGLIERIRNLGERARSKFEGKYERFCSDRTRQSFRELYGKRGR